MLTEKAKIAKSKKAPSSPWHYPGKGDFPPVGKGVLAQVADMSGWIRAVLNKEPVGSINRYQQDVIYGGVFETTKTHYWDGVPFHGVVLAWRERDAPNDLDMIRETVAAAQREMMKNDNLLFFMMASALNMMPDKMKFVIQEKCKRFKRTMNALGDKAIVTKNTPVKSGTMIEYIDDARGLVFTVETHYDHAVIVQIKKGESESHYARDFTRVRKIYPTEKEAVAALIAEAQKQKWREAS